MGPALQSLAVFLWGGPRVARRTVNAADTVNIRRAG